MQLDSLIPRDFATFLYVVIASILAWLGGWFTRRRREPIEIEKLRAETRNIHITTENAQVGVGMEAFREMQAVILKAEQRREEFLRREEQLRKQVRFWRCKAEEFDGELIDSRDVNGQLKARLKIKQDALDKATALISYHSIPFSDAELPEVRRLLDILNADLKSETD